ncbi:MAG: response regulator [Ignavibacteriales bacterium]|nr:response regulator [Ignavibacteriales bacterium]
MPDKNRMVAKDHLLASDKYLKNNLFDKAREEIQNASQVDPTNPYISAFEERLRLFQETYTKRHANIEAQTTEQDRNVIDTKVINRPKPVLLVNPSPTSLIEPPQVSSKEELLTSTIMEMRQQIAELNRTLNIERVAREEIVTQQLEASVRQLRAALEKAWQFGAPKNNESDELQRLVRVLNIPPEVETSVMREVKLMMYSKAVKEVIAKRKLLRSSSSTLEWLRKIYQVSINEYLEYESHFLTELVTSQFRGTMLFVSPNEKLRGEFVPRFKETGFAVASASSAEEALEKVEKLNPAIILCDTMSEIGGLSGFKFLHFWRTRSKNQTVPFILLCEPSEENQISASELKSAEGYISKSCEFDEINTLVNEKLQHIREYIGSLV